MKTPCARGGRSLAAGFLALSLLVSAFSATFLVPGGVALAEDGVALGDTLILDGPGGQYGILTVAPAGSAVHNPAFDITPARLVSVLVTEDGPAAPGAD